MRRGRMALGGLALAAAVLVVGVSAAAAASPRDIYRDWADNGRLDRTYSTRDLQGALSDTTLQGYRKQGFVPAVVKQLGKPKKQAVPAISRTSKSPGTLPFTGFDIALLVGGAAVLLLVGGGMRRLGRPKA